MDFTETSVLSMSLQILGDGIKVTDVGERLSRSTKRITYFVTATKFSSRASVKDELVPAGGAKAVKN